MNNPTWKPSTLRENTYKCVYQALKINNWNRTKASKILGITQRTIRYYIVRMREAGIEIPDNMPTPSAKKKLFVPNFSQDQIKEIMGKIE